ncbi:MAG: type II toxin-antitoxin system VapC family toxin [Sulfolobales archaeon]
MRNTRLLYDSSALLNTVRLYGPRALDIIRSSYTLTITPYEIGNALWKEALLVKRISLEESISVLSHIARLLSMVNVVEPRDKESILRLAHDIGFTYYEASYVVASHEIGGVLVSDDRKLLRKILSERDRIVKQLGREVIVISSKEAAERV